MEKKGKLEEIFLVYEDRIACNGHLVRHGVPPKAAEQLVHWLQPKGDIKLIFQAVADRAAKENVKVIPYKLGPFLARFKKADFKNSFNILLWNLTDGQFLFKGSHLPSLGVLYDIPYFGCPPSSQALGQDKFQLSKISDGLGVSIPAATLLEGEQILASIGEPVPGQRYFVKPNSLGNKIGIINGKSLSDTFEEAVKVAAEIGNSLNCRMLVQQFIEGEEIRVTYINAGDGQDIKFNYSLINAGLPKCSYISSDARDSAYEGGVININDDSKWENYREFKQKIRDFILKFAKVVPIKDYFSFEFRIKDKKVYLIDFNPGAFLLGEYFDNYVRTEFGMTQGEALFTALRNCHEGNAPYPFRTGIQHLDKI